MVTNLLQGLPVMGESARQPYLKHSVGSLLAILVAVTALAVMFGWVFHIAALVQLAPNWAPMQFNTALCFLCCAGALVGLDAGKFRWALVPAALAVAVAGVTLAETIFHFNCGLNAAIIKAPFVMTATSDAGRMSPISALCLFLNGTPLLLAARSGSVYTRPIAGWFVLAAGFLAAMSVFGYVAGMQSIYGIGGFTLMALDTAICTLLISGGIWLFIWQAGLRKYNAARWFLLPASLIMITLAGFFSNHLMYEWESAVTWHKHTFDVLLKLDAVHASLIDLQDGNHYVQVNDSSGLDGYATTQRIRADRRFEQLPIVAMTADAVVGGKEMCLAVGMSAFLTKPIRPHELYTTLEKWILH